MNKLTKSLALAEKLRDSLDIQIKLFFISFNFRELPGTNTEGHNNHKYDITFY